MFGKRIGFLKFVADVFDKETGKKVSDDNPHVMCFLLFWASLVPIILDFFLLLHYEVKLT